MMTMRTEIRRAVIAVTVAALLGGCTEAMKVEKQRNRAATNSGLRKDTRLEAGPRAYGSQLPQGPIVHNNTKLSYNQDLSSEVSRLNGVYGAIVMVTDHNAYVAVLVEDSSTGTRGSGSKKETNNSGTSLGRYNPQTFGQYADPSQLATGINNYHTVQNHEDLTHEFKQRIAKTIRTNDPNLYEIYISANRDYINQLNAYAQESRQGRPLDPYVGQFNELVNRHFGQPEQHDSHR